MLQVREQKFRLTGEKKHNGNRVADSKPVDLNITHSEVAIPARGPGNVTRVPYHTVREHHCRHFS